MGFCDRRDNDVNALIEVVRNDSTNDCRVIDVTSIERPSDRVKIAIVGKYTELTDAYLSVREALVHGGIANDAGVDIDETRIEDGQVYVAAEA